MPEPLLTPLLKDGLRRLHYFNGRVLTAEDFAAEQTALRRRDEQLGQALGEGVVDGLMVTLDAAVSPRTVVTVEAGTAVSPGGHLLHLPARQSVSVVPEGAAEALGSGAFATCGPAATVTPTGYGAYVLVLTAASGLEGSVPYVGLADDGVATSCARRWDVEGVQFRLVHLDVDDDALMPAALAEPIRERIGGETPAGRARLRNLLAHWCLGTVEAGGVADLLTAVEGGPAEATYGPLDALRDRSDDAVDRLADCDVPLALLYWTPAGISFVDAWAVRRRLHRRPAALAPPLPASDRRTAEAEAARLQFQAHLTALAGPGVSSVATALIRLREWFRFVPPVGVVPERVGGRRGFTHLELFEGCTVRDPVFIEGARVGPLLQAATAYAPVDLDEDEFFWLYRVRQNRQGGSPAYLLFTSGFVPYQGDPQFDLSRWAFANYGPGLAILAPADDPVLPTL